MMKQELLTFTQEDMMSQDEPINHFGKKPNSEEGGNRPIRVVVTIVRDDPFEDTPEI
jgi:hypothetical protein